MVVMMKLKYVDDLSGGRKRFRRRFPKAVSAVLGEEFFQVPMKAREGAALVVEQEALLAEYEKMVTKAKRQAAGQGSLSPLEHWREAVSEVTAMKEAIVGDLTEDDRREVLADDLHRRGADPVLVKAAIAPDAKEPPVSLQDAKHMYEQERLGANPGRNQRNRLERVCRRVEEALGPLGKVALVDLRDAHGRKLRDYMQSVPANGKGGKLLAPLTIRRELDMVSTMVNLAIKSFDLEKKAKNPFEGISLATPNTAPQTEWELRDPLPEPILKGMRERMTGKLRSPELGLIWRILEGTGCRGAEVVGLRVEDVFVDHTYPHIWVRWHEDRSVKTKTSIRAVPLVGDALAAAKEALEMPREGSHLLFPKYAREAGPDAVSQALMKHLRTFTKNPRHVVYSLRHNMKDRLVTAGVDQRDENRILGHSLGGVGDRVYGGEDARLKAAYEAMKKALGVPE
jgi:integrase